MDKPALARLAFWGMNMTFATSGKNNWPGFTYNDAEWVRLSKLADAVDAARFGLYMLVCTITFIALAAAAIVGLFVPAACETDGRFDGRFAVFFLRSTSRSFRKAWPTCGKSR